MSSASIQRSKKKKNNAREDECPLPCDLRMQHTKKTMQKSNPAATRTANKNSQPVINMSMEKQRTWTADEQRLVRKALEDMWATHQLHPCFIKVTKQGQEVATSALRRLLNVHWRLTR